MLEETTERPILIGRPEVIDARIKRAGLKIKPGDTVEIVNPEQDSRYRAYWEAYHDLQARHGVSPGLAQTIMRTNTTAIGAVMVHKGDADSLICGTFGEFRWHLKYITRILGTKDWHPVGALSLMIQEDGPLFIADTAVHSKPTPQEISELVISCARHVRRFGIEPNIAICSQSQFGNMVEGSGPRMRAALALLDAQKHDFCLLYTSPSPRDLSTSRMPSSA